MADFTFDAATHTYRLDGEELPSVTHIIRFLSADTDKSRPWLRDAAARRGTAVHEACALIDYDEMGALDGIDPEHRPYIDAYLAFLQDYAPRWDMIEASMFGEWTGTPYAGTIDRFGYIRGRPVIADIKTGTSGTDAQHRAQLSGYCHLIEHNFDLPPELAILQLCKDGTYKFKYHERDMILFDACVYLHKATEKKKRKKVTE